MIIYIFCLEQLNITDFTFRQINYPSNIDSGYIYALFNDDQMINTNNTNNNTTNNNTKDTNTINNTNNSTSNENSNKNTVVNNHTIINKTLEIIINFKILRNMGSQIDYLKLIPYTAYTTYTGDNSYLNKYGALIKYIHGDYCNANKSKL